MEAESRCGAAMNDESQLSVKDLLLSQSWEKRNEAKAKTPKK